MEDELTLKDLVEILSRKKRLILITTLIFLAAALAYALLSKNIYASTAVVSVSPLRVKAQLEQKIQLQQRGLLTFDGLKALAFAQGTLKDVFDELQNRGRLPEEWKGLGEYRGIAALAKALKIDDATPSQKSLPGGEVPTLIAKFTAKSHDPNLAAEIANIWAEATALRVNELPTKQLKANLAALELQIGPAEERYRESQKRWEDFQRRVNLEGDRAELKKRTAERVELSLSRERLIQEIKEREARLALLQEAAGRESRSVMDTSVSPELIVVNQSLAKAQEALKRELARAEEKWKNDRESLARYIGSIPLDRWKAELGKRVGRAADIRHRLAQIATEKTKLEAELEATTAQLSREPERITLTREAVSDPALASLGADNLAGLVLENEELNPLYVGLKERRNQLVTRLNALNQESEALKRELAQHEKATADLRAKIASSERRLEELKLRAELSKTRYEALAKLENKIAGAPENLRLETSNPEYRRLKTEVINTKAELASLRANLSEIERRIAENDRRIAELKSQVAREELEADQIQETLRLAKEAYLALVQKRTDLRIELASVQDSLAQVFSPAYPVYEKIAPKRGTIIAVATLLGVMIGVFLAFVSASLETPPSKGDQGRSPSP